MTAQKQSEVASSRSPQVADSKRQPWKKKTPVEAVLSQIDRLRESLTVKEEELKQSRRQLQKLEEVRKILEAN